MKTQVLIVEPDVRRRLTLQRALSLIATVTACGDFQTAYEHVRVTVPDLLITNLRLRAHNGVHLVALVGAQTRAIVCIDAPDAGLTRSVQAIGARVETPQRLAAAAVSFITARRSPGTPPKTPYIRREKAAGLR